MSFRRRQSRAASLTEAAANVIVGYALAIILQVYAYPLFGIATTLGTDSAIAALFTAASLVRSYLLRRIFERLPPIRIRRPIHART